MKTIDKEKVMRSQLKKAGKSPYHAYKKIVMGDGGITDLFIYELCTLLFETMPGALGYLLRRRFYPVFLKKSGSNFIIGKNVTFRHPKKIHIGNNVTIDDNSLIDAHGAGSECLTIGNDTVINRNCMLQAKAGPIRVGDRSSIGSNSVVSSLDGIYIGNDVIIGGRCYFSAGAYHLDDIDTPIIDQGPYAKGPIHVGENSYVGAGAMIVGSINIGKGAVIGAGSLVLHDVPEFAIVAGNPAKLIRSRTEKRASRRL